MDPLAQTIRLICPKAPNWKQGQAAGAWAFRFPKTSGVAFGLMVAGECRLRVPGNAPRALHEGDYFLLRAPAAWTLDSGEGSTAIDFSAAPGGHRSRPVLAGDATGGSVARLIGGHFAVDADNAELLEGVVPAVVTIRASEPTAARLRGVLQLIGDEASSDRPGRALVLERLLEVMLVEAIRYEATQVGDSREGLLRGLAVPPVAHALRAIHANIRRAWTVSALASAAGMSRSAFANLFTRTIGVAPIAYLLRWRMAVAKEALRGGRRTLDDVALACGYQSVSAFSTAFHRTVGCPPGRYGAAARRESVEDR